MFNKNAARIIATVFSASLVLSSSTETKAEMKNNAKEKLKLAAIKDQLREIKATDKFSGIKTAEKDTENIEVKTEGDPEEEIRIIVEMDGDGAINLSRKSEKEVILDQEEVQEEVEDITDNDVKNTFGNLINGFSIDAKRGDLEEIASLPGVSKVTEANVYYPSMSTAVDLTQVAKVWQEYGYDGEGLVVSIIDTGIDYTHKDMRDPESYDDMKIKESNVKEGPGKYYTAKVPYGYNFADDNDEIIDTTGSEHGMHVAGIVGADASDEDYNNGTGIRGVAPEAQLLAMKVFSNNAAVKGAFSDDIIAAIEESVKQGADVINMSLGSSAGYVDSEDPEQIAIKNATDAGTLCVVSAGNSYYSTYPYWFGSVKDVGTVGAPGLAEDALQVASYENSSVKLAAFSLNVDGTSTIIGHTTADIDPNNVFAKGEELEVVDCGYGTTDDFKDKNLAGKVALIQRGNITFIEKAQNAQAAGAALAIIYNNEAGGDEYINMATDKSIKIPYIFISNTDGKKVKEALGKNGKISFDSYVTTVGNTADSELSSFTSWGPAPNLDFAPQVSSIGGNVYSTVNNDRYTSMSGTSMSSPNVAGSSALILQALKENNIGLSGRELVEFVKNTIINTAKVQYDTEYYEADEMPYSPRRQGSGLIEVADAIKNRVLALTDEGKATASLKEIGNITSFTVNLRNYGDKDASYKLDTVGGVLTSYNPGFGVASEMVFDTNLEGASISFDQDEVTVPANGTAKVKVTLNIPEDAAKDIFAEGFISFTSDDKNIPSLVMPFMGYYGDWSDELIVNDPVWDFNAENILPASAAALSVLGKYTYAGLKGEDEYGDIVISKDEIAVSPNGDELADELTPYLFMLRNAKNITVDILDKDMNIVAENVAKETKVSKQIFNSTSSAVLRKSLTWDGKIYNKSTGEYEVVPGQYYMNVKSKVDLDTAAEQSFVIPVKVDITEPTIEVLSEDKTNSTSYQLKLKISDDLSGVDPSSLIVYANGSKVNGEITVDGDVVTINTNLEDGKVNNIEYGIFDNAYNFAEGEVNVKVGEISYEKPAVSFNYNDSEEFNTNNIVLEGKVTGDYGKLLINKNEVTVEADGSFKVDLTLAEGRNYVPVYLEDVNGEKIESYSLKFYCDTIAPVIELATPCTENNEILTPMHKVVLKGNVSDNTLGYKFSINGEVLLTELNDGYYGNDTNRKSFEKEIDVEDGDIILLEAEDLFGNKTSEKYTVKVDENALVLKAEGISNNGYYNSDVTPVFTVNDQYKIVSQTLNGSSYDGKSITEEGSYNLVVEVGLNSTEDYAETVKYVFDFVIDKTPAEITVNGVSDGEAYNISVIPAVSTSENATVEMKLNGEEYDGAAISEEGQYELEVKAVDYAGNKSSKTVKFTIDKTAPVITINGVTNGMKYNKDVVPEVSVDDSEASLEITLNGETYDGNKITENGNYVLVVTATDKAGNISNATINFIVAKQNSSDAPAPGSPATEKPGDNSGTINTPITNDEENIDDTKKDNNGPKDKENVDNGKNDNNAAKAENNKLQVKPTKEAKGSIPTTGNENVIYVTIFGIMLIAAGGIFCRRKKVR